MYFAVAGVMGMVSGRLIDRYGPKPVLIFGSTTMAIGFFLLSRVTNLWQFFAVYFLMAVGWSGTSPGPGQHLDLQVGFSADGGWPWD